MIGGSATLEELLDERIATEAAKIAEERVRAMFEFTEFDPDEVHGFMDSREAAAFLGLPYARFKEIATGLPRHAITPERFGYLRRELLEHFRGSLDDSPRLPKELRRTRLR